MICHHCHRQPLNDMLREFSCSHKICFYCLIGSILKDQINKISNIQESIEFKCKCLNGNLIISYNEFNNFQPFEYNKMKFNCESHQYNECNIYCKQCKKLICTQCTEDPQSHQNHNKFHIDDYYEDIIKNLSHLKFGNFNDFSSNLEKFYINYLDQITSLYNVDIMKIDCAIQRLNDLKTKLKNEMDESIMREEHKIKLIRFYYSKVYNDINILSTSSKDIDFYSVKFISKVKFDIDNLRVQKNDFILPLIEKIEEEITNVITNEKINVQLIYPYFGQIKQFIKSNEIIGAHLSSIKGVVYIQETNQIATASYDKTLKVYSLYPSMNLLYTLQGHESPINTLCSNGKFIISGAKDGEIRIWSSTDEFKCIQIIERQPDEINYICSMKKNFGFVSCCQNRKATIWENEDNIFVTKQEIDGHEDGTTCAIESSKNELIIGSKDGTITIWKESPDAGNSGESYICVQALGEMVGGVSCMCEYKRRILVGFNISSIKVVYYDEKEKEYREFCVIDEHIKRINCIIILKDDRFASCSFDKSIRIWNMNQATSEIKCDQILKEHSLCVYDICESKDGKLISVSGDKKVIQWKRVKNI